MNICYGIAWKNPVDLGRSPFAGFIEDRLGFTPPNERTSYGHEFRPMEELVSEEKSDLALKVEKLPSPMKHPLGHVIKSVTQITLTRKGHDLPVYVCCVDSDDIQFEPRLVWGEEIASERE